MWLNIIPNEKGHKKDKKKWKHRVVVDIQGTKDDISELDIYQIYAATAQENAYSRNISSLPRHLKSSRQLASPIIVKTNRNIVIV